VNIDEAKMTALAHSLTFVSAHDDYEDIIECARQFEAYLLGDTVVKQIFIMTSQTYGWNPADSDHEDAPSRHVIGVYQTREAAINYRDNATPPVTDAIIEDWGVE
jgi:hypothetical protein